MPVQSPAGLPGLLPSCGSGIIRAERFAGGASREQEAFEMTITVAHITPILALIGGIVILIAPRILAYIVAFWLIIYGVLGIWPNLLNGVM
jgi:hypothetical protein